MVMHQMTVGTKSQLLFYDPDFINMTVEDLELTPAFKVT